MAAGGTRAATPAGDAAAVDGAGGQASFGQASFGQASFGQGSDAAGRGAGGRVRLFLDHAWLPEGWAERVALDVADGTIARVEPDASPEGRERVAGFVLPGLASLHSHAFQRGLAGLAERRGPNDDDFWSWRTVMYRFLGAMTPDDVEAIAAQAYVDMLEGGFTAVGEFHYLHRAPDGSAYDDPAETAVRIAAAASETGIGLTLLPCFYAQGGFNAAPPTAGQTRFLHTVDAFLRLLDRSREIVRALPDARLGIAPHSLRAVAPADLARLLDAWPEGPVHIHAAEQVREVADCLAWSGLRPVEWLLANANVDARWCLIHATHMTPAEAAALGQSGAVAGLCPITEANLGDGVFDAPTFFGAGGAFGVGTDSNVLIGAAGELRGLEYAQRLALRSRNVLAAGPGGSTGERLYGGALAGGARALARRIGAIAPGFRADFVTLDANHPAFAAARTGTGAPARLDAYLFGAGERAIDAVFVGGEQVVASGVHRARDRVRARYAAALGRLAGA